MDSRFYIGSLILVLVGAGAYLYLQKPYTEPFIGTPVSTSVDVAPLATSTHAQQEYTMTEVASHANAASCWSAINGTVYDLTSWIGQHPGGRSAILGLCGTDGSAMFNGQHGGERRPANELSRFSIGALSASAQ